MIEERTYSRADLEPGICCSCGEKSEEILIGDGRCLDCIELEIFYNQTMKECYQRPRWM